MQSTASARPWTDYAWAVLIFVTFLALVLWLAWWALKRSEDPVRLVVKWLVSAVVMSILIFVVVPIVARGGYAGAFIGIPFTAVCGLLMAIIWRRDIAMIIARPFGALYDGGNQQVEPQAYYSLAEAKRKRGQYPEAIAAIRKQLDQFPTDFTGQMLLAEIQAENLNDLPTAAITIQRICQQPDHAPRNLAYALNTLADWQLKYSLDPDAARTALEQVVALLPDTEFALLAEQRIGHLASREQLTETRERTPIHIPAGVPNLGLQPAAGPTAPAATDPGQRARELVQHLEQHPQDSEAREQLAILYADHYQRLDLAAEQLSQLINQPQQPGRSVVRWLNLLADLQIRHGCTYEAVAETLTQITTRYPNLAAADLARNRLELLRLELKGKTATPAVKMGQYEQNIGLKYGPPSRQ